MIPLPIDVVEKGLDRLLYQFQGKKNIEALLGGLLQGVQDAETLAFQVLNESELPTAVGVQLDMLGGIFGVPRDGRDDTTYRAAIFARISVLTTKSTVDSVLTVVKNMADPDHAILRENFYTTLITDPNRAYTNAPSPLPMFGGPNYNNETNFAGGANVAFNAALGNQWTKPSANVIVEILAKDDDFTTIPDGITDAVQGAVAAGVKASTVMMRKSFYMEGLVEGFSAIQSDIVEVDIGNPTDDRLAYTTASATPAASGNIVAKYATDRGTALSTNRNRFREIRQQQPAPTIIESGDGSSLFVLSATGDMVMGVGRVFIRKTKTGSEFIAPLQVVRFNSDLTKVIADVRTITADFGIGTQEYWECVFETQSMTDPTNFSTATFFSPNPAPTGWTNTLNILQPLLVQDEDGSEVLLLDFTGTKISSIEESEDRIGILMEIKHG